MIISALPKPFTHIHSQNRKNCIAIGDEYTSEELKTKFVVAEELLNSNAFRYYVFDSHAAFLNYLYSLEYAPPMHEVIFKWSKQKLKFDIDGCGDDFTPEELLDELTTHIIDNFNWVYGEVLTEENITTTTSSGIDVNGKMKHSFHIIVNGYYVEGNEEAYDFTLRVMQLMPLKYHDYIDIGVNKSVQNFRLIGCAKTGSSRVKQIMHPDIHTPEDTIITMVKNCKLVRGIDAVEKEAERIDIVQDDLDRIMEMAESELNGSYRYDRTIMRGTPLLIFRRTAPSHCNLCNRIHHNDNTAMVRVSPVDEDSPAVNLYYLCRHAPKQSIYVGSFIPIGALDAETREREEQVQRVIDANIENPPMLPDTTFIDLARNKNIYDEPQLRDYELVGTLLVRAAMKMGKTKKLIEYIRKNHPDTELRPANIKFISFRQTFSANIKEKFPGFTLYSDVVGDLTADKLIVQVESLHRMNINPTVDIPDLVILDESELILEQFDSGLLKQFNKAWQTFVWMLCNAKNVICMDAAMSDRTYNVMQMLRPNHDILLHCNTHKNAVDDTYYFTSNKSAFYSAIFKDITAGLRLALPMNSLAEAETAAAVIKKRFPTKIIGFYSSRTPPSVKARHFSNVAKHWSSYDILIYTPTVSAGVSFEVKHYDKVYAYFTDISCTVEVCLQMLGRVRDVAEKEIVICLNVSGGNFPATTNAIKRHIYTQRENLFKQMDDSCLSFHYTPDGCIKYHESNYFHLWLENTRARNLSRNSFTKRIIRNIINYGAGVLSMAVDECDPEFTVIGKENRTTKKELGAIKNQRIANAPDLTQPQIMDIKRAMTSQEDVDEVSVDAYNRYRLRNGYKYGGVIDETFVKKYSSSKVRREFKNIRRILHSGTSMEFALETIQREELEIYLENMDGDDEHQYRDINRSYVFEQHRIAVAILSLCGCQHITDRRFIITDDIMRCVLAETNRVYGLFVAANKVFHTHTPDITDFIVGDKTPGEFMTCVIGHFNKVLQLMYGIRLKIHPEDGMCQLTAITNFDIIPDVINTGVPNIHGVWEPPLE